MANEMGYIKRFTGMENGEQVSIRVFVPKDSPGKLKSGSDITKEAKQTLKKYTSLTGKLISNVKTVRGYVHQNKPEKDVVIIPTKELIRRPMNTGDITKLRAEHDAEEFVAKMLLFEDRDKSEINEYLRHFANKISELRSKL